MMPAKLIRFMKILPSLAMKKSSLFDKSKQTYFAQTEKLYI